MSRNIEIFLVLTYNLALLAGACYMIQVYDWSAWLLVLVLIFGASWDKEKTIDKEKAIIEIGK